MLVRGVWRLWLMPPQEVVLGGIEGHETGGLFLDLTEQLGIPDGNGNLAGIELQEVLIRPIPRSRRGEMTHQYADSLVRQGKNRADLPGFAGHDLPDRDQCGIAQVDRGIDHRKCGPRTGGGVGDEPFEVVARRGLPDGREDPTQLRVATP